MEGLSRAGEPLEGKPVRARSHVGPIRTAYSERVSFVRSRQRVADHGEVFTPPWLVQEMLDLVRHESERIDSRFLEPACGSGNFLVPTLRRKLATVQATYGKSQFEKSQYALLGLMSLYGIELLPDNVQECRDNLIEVFSHYLQLGGEAELYRAAKAVLAANIVHGDALTMTSSSGQPITFPEWAYRGKGKFQRRDFRYDDLLQRSSFGVGTLFATLAKHEIFSPLRDYPPMSVREIAALDGECSEGSEVGNG